MTAMVWIEIISQVLVCLIGFALATVRRETSARRNQPFKPDGILMPETTLTWLEAKVRGTACDA